MTAASYRSSRRPGASEIASNSDTGVGGVPRRDRAPSVLTLEAIQFAPLEERTASVCCALFHRRVDGTRNCSPSMSKCASCPFCLHNHQTTHSRRPKPIHDGVTTMSGSRRHYFGRYSGSVVPRGYPHQREVEAPARVTGTVRAGRHRSDSQVTAGDAHTGWPPHTGRRAQIESIARCRAATALGADPITTPSDLRLVGTAVATVGSWCAPAGLRPVAPSNPYLGCEG